MCRRWCGFLRGVHIDWMRGKRRFIAPRAMYERRDGVSLIRPAHRNDSITRLEARMVPSELLCARGIRGPCLAHG